MYKKYNTAKQHSKQRGIEFSIDFVFIEKLFGLQNGLCFYTGEPLRPGMGGSSVSIDRVDPKCGYVEDNIVLTSWKINNMKESNNYKEFVTLCSAVVENDLNYRENLL